MKRVIFAILVIVITETAQAKYSGGSGEPNDPYEIATPADIIDINNYPEDFNKCFLMTADVNLAPNIPGNRIFTSSLIGGTFSGIFDGAGHKICNLTIDNNSGEDDISFFRGVQNGQIKNLGLEDVNITAVNSQYISSLAAWSRYSAISNCYSSGNITGWALLGGLIALNDSIVIDCFSACNLTGRNNSWLIGGIAAMNSIGTIINCHYSGNIVAPGTSSAIGGIAGQNNGIPGEEQGSILNCYSTGSINGGAGSSYLGGLAGYNKGVISNSVSAVNVAGDANSSSIGGLVGINDSNIENSYSVGNVSGSDRIGGLVGFSGGKVKYSYSIGSVTGISRVGGLVGFASSPVLNCYFLITAGLNNHIGTALTDAQMKQQASFVNWDFVWESANGTDDIWAICQDVNYPKLAWQFVVGDSDSDKDVDFIDFAPFGNKWMQPDSTLYCGGQDLTGDGFVDIYDLDAFTENWLEGL